MENYNQIPNNKIKIGVDIGGSHISLGVINQKNEIIEKVEKDIKIKPNMDSQILKYLEEQISKLSENREIDIIGISVPGNTKGTTASNMHNLGIDLIDFKPLKDRFNTKLNVLNDGKCAALAEQRMGAMKGYEDGVFLCLGTGIGSGVFLKGQLLQCKRNGGFEIGHMIIDKNGLDCNCGKKGCFEAYCSIAAFKRNVYKILHNGIEFEGAIDGVDLRKEMKNNLNNTGLNNLINEYINNLIIGVSNLIDIFEPEIICFGGSFVYFRDYIFDKFVEEMEKRKYVFNKQTPLPKFALAEFNNDSGIIGSTLL